MRLQPRILYTATEVRSAIVDLFRDSRTERVAISAFVGDGADAYLPSPKGLHLVCSPTPGATNPNAIRLLIKKGVRVEFVDSLHMKVYWSKTRGAVITSANLSTNAMGIGGLKEAGVLVGPNELDIGRVLKSLERRPAERDLRRLDREHKEFYRRVGWRGIKRTARSYREWFESPAREQWSFVCYSTTSQDLSETATNSIREEFDKKPSNWIWIDSATVTESDWILLAYTSRGRLRALQWLFADRVVKVPRSDNNYDREFPFEVIQIHGMKHYPPPPFSVNEQFRKTMGQVLQKRLIDETASPYELPVKVLRNIYDGLS